MKIILLKAEQGALFDVLVPVKGGVRRDGTPVKPHYARRRKRLDQGNKPEQATLFGAAPAEHTQSGVDYNQKFEQIKMPDFGVYPGIGRGQRRALNAKAVALLDKDEYSAQDRETLSRYSGQGGVGDSLNEYYTRPDVAAAMWSVLHGLGISGDKSVLEPSCGTGVFLATAPAGVRVTGVELDATSSRIAQILHPQHEVVNSSLEQFAIEDGRQFDAVIGNVPFGLRGSLISQDKKDLARAEQYFLDTALDKTADGGIVALIVPTGVLDAKSGRAFRERLTRKGEFLGALRMPNTAFEAAHTEVTTDIVFFRRRPAEVAGALGAVPRRMLEDLDLWDAEFVAGNYFMGRGAPNVLGRMEEGWRAKAGIGADITVEGSMQGVAQAIAGFAGEEPTAEVTVQDVLGAAADDEVLRRRIINGSLKTPYHVAREGETKTLNGVVYRLEGEPLRWHAIEGTVESPKIQAAITLAERIDQLFMRGDEATDEERAGVVAALDKYIEEYGNPSRDKELTEGTADHRVLWRLIGSVATDGGYSDLVTGHKSDKSDNTDLGTVAQRIALRRGQFSVDELANEWTGGNRDEALDHLFAGEGYAVDADGRTWTTIDQYLSGDLWEKLDAARAALKHEGLNEDYAAKYRAQIEALVAEIDQQPLENVEVTLAAGWVPLDVVEAYLNHEVAEYKRRHAGAAWSPEPFTLRYEHGVYYVHGGLWGAKLLGTYLNRTGVRKDDLPTIERMNKQFVEWLCASEHRDRVEDVYNRKFRGFANKRLSDAPFPIPGMAPDREINAYHYSGLRWALDAGKGIIADDVGLGKTLRGLMLAKLARDSGQADKPVIVAPKSVLANWVAEAESWFPGSRIMTIGETVTKNADGEYVTKSDTKDDRDRKLHELSQNGGYDFVFITMPAWNDIDLDPIKKEEYASQDFWNQRAESMDQAGDKRRRQIRESYEQAIARRDFEKRTDVIYFNDLGVDMLIMDEAHAYKGLYAPKSRFGETPKFLGGSALSNRALDTNFKTGFVREQNGGKNVYLLTATPTKNSPLEIYSMLSHVAPEEFLARGIKNSEDFLDRYCEFRVESILAVNGQIQESPVVAGFKNLDELRQIMDKYINRRTADDVGLVLPGRDDRTHLIEMTERQQAVYDELREKAAEASRSDTGDSHIFAIMDKMHKAATDLGLLGMSGTRSPKLEAAAKNIADLSVDGGQVVFADHNDLHEKLAQALVKRGVKRSDIAIVNAKTAKTAGQRQTIADRFNAGKIKVVIGNTATMGEGMNLQKRTTDIHHLELPWEPASMQQRNGRGLRQGNKREAVRIHNYLSKGSFDGYRYQTMAAKKDWQDILWTGADRVENLSRAGNFDRHEMMIMLSADPDKAREDYAKNRGAAEERAAALARQGAADKFAKLGEMQRSYTALSNKDTASAVRLKQSIEKLRTGLQANKHFPSELLDPGVQAIMQPHTGHIWREGVGAQIEAGNQAGVEVSDTPSRWVVSGVSTQDGKVSMREYGKPDGGRTIELDISEMGSGISPFDYSHATEQREMEAEHDARLAAGVSDLNDLSGLRDTPDTLLKKHHTVIQSALKDAINGYRGTWANVIAVRDPGGKPVVYRDYDVRDKLGDHDLMLPSAESRSAMLQAYADMEFSKRILLVTRDTGRRRRSYYSSNQPRVLSERYPGWEYSNVQGNPWAVAGRKMFGDKFMADADALVQRQALERAAKAGSFREAFHSLIPLLKVSGYKDSAAWTEPQLLSVAQAAEKHGVLGQPINIVREGEDWKNALPDRMLVANGNMGETISIGNWLAWHGERQPGLSDVARTKLRGLAREERDDD